MRGGKLREYSAHLIPEAGWKMMPKLVSSGMLVAGDAAGSVAAGLYIEGINYAMQSGLAAGKPPSRRAASVISPVTPWNATGTLVAPQRVYRFSRFPPRPDFVNGERLQNNVSDGSAWHGNDVPGGW